MDDEQKFVEIDLVFVKVAPSGLSVIFRDEAGRELFLPEKLIDWTDGATEGDVVEVEMPEWLAEREGLI